MGKLVFVNRYFYPDHSATSQLLSDLAFDLAGRGADVRVITGRQRYDEPAARLEASGYIHGVRVWRVPTTRFGRARLAGRAVDYVSFYVSACYRLWREVRPGDVVIAKTDPPLISLVAAMVAKWRGATLVNWMQDLFPEVARALGVTMVTEAVSNRLKTLRNWSANAARCNVVLGELMASHLANEGVDQRRIKVIENWIDDDVVPVPHVANPLRHEWGLDGKFVIAYSGNLGRAHEFETILAAAGLLWKDRDIVFLFVGGGAQVDNVRRQVAVRQLGNVVFKPYQPRERLAESLSSADVHLISLRPALEGLIVPSKFYGAVAVGRPVVFIGDQKGEIPRILARDRCGYAVPVGDAYALAVKLRTLSLDPALAQRLGGNGRRLFLGRYRKDLALSAWRDVLAPANGMAGQPVDEQNAASGA